MPHRLFTRRIFVGIRLMHLAPEVQQQVRIIAASQDTTIQALLTEALSNLFEKQGYPRIAE